MKKQKKSETRDRCLKFQNAKTGEVWYSATEYTETNAKTLASQLTTENTKVFVVSVSERDAEQRR